MENPPREEPAPDTRTLRIVREPQTPGEEAQISRVQDLLRPHIAKPGHEVDEDFVDVVNGIAKDCQMSPADVWTVYAGMVAIDESGPSQ